MAKSAWRAPRDLERVAGSVPGGNHVHRRCESLDERRKEARIQRRPIADRGSVGFAESWPIHSNDTVADGQEFGEIAHLVSRRDRAQRRQAEDRGALTDLVVGRTPAPISVEPIEDVGHTILVADSRWVGLSPVVCPERCDCGAPIEMDGAAALAKRFGPVRSNMSLPSSHDA
jgi:hypothetical protein